MHMDFNMNKVNIYKSINNVNAQPSCKVQFSLLNINKVHY